MWKLCTAVSAASLRSLKPMTPVMMQRQLAVASFHTGAAALEQIGASAGDLFDPSAVRGRETLQRMIGAPQDVEQRGTRRLHAVSGLGSGAAGGDALEIQGGDELLEDRRFHLRGQCEGLDPGGHGGEEERERGEPLHGQALGLHDAFAGALGQLGGLGQSLQARPDVGEARRHALHRLRLSIHRIIRVIQLSMAMRTEPLSATKIDPPGDPDQRQFPIFCFSR